LALEIGYRGPRLPVLRIESKPAVGYLIRTHVRKNDRPWSLI